MNFNVPEQTKTVIIPAQNWVPFKVCINYQDKTASLTLYNGSLADGDFLDPDKMQEVAIPFVDVLALDKKVTDDVAAKVVEQAAMTDEVIA